MNNLKTVTFIIFINDIFSRSIQGSLLNSKAIISVSHSVKIILHCIIQPQSNYNNIRLVHGIVQTLVALGGQK